ncbi:MAG: hypothetical protein WBB89_02720, partial [Candidatus Acidiferrum sp.]
MVHGGKEPLEVYFASWKSPNQPKEAKGEPIGYFYFLEGGFRWDSLISFPKFKISNAKIVPARLIKKVEPVYPADAAAQHISGTVRVYYVIGGDGAVYNPCNFRRGTIRGLLPSESCRRSSASMAVSTSDNGRQANSNKCRHG